MTTNDTTSKVNLEARVAKLEAALDKLAFEQRVHEWWIGLVMAKGKEISDLSLEALRHALNKEEYYAYDAMYYEIAAEEEQRARLGGGGS